MAKFTIEVKNLQKSFGKHVVLQDINLKVPQGCVFALLGPNGAGKTTLINILSTLTAPDSGSVRVGGHDVMTHPEDVKLTISLTGQSAAVDDMLTAEENLRMMGRLSGLSASAAKSRAAELLKFFDLEADAQKKVKTYSGGMRRRLDLAISLVVRRPVLFLDEPTTGLDTRSRRALWTYIQNLATQGVTIFLTTQYLEEADQLADVIAIINEGRVVAEGSAAQLKSRLSGEVVEVRGTNGEVIREIATDGSVHGLKKAVDEIARSLPKDSRVSIRKPTMDDVFMNVTDKKMEVSQ